jgi:hypothetical protein
MFDHSHLIIRVLRFLIDLLIDLWACLISRLPFTFPCRSFFLGSGIAYIAFHLLQIHTTEWKGFPRHLSPYPEVRQAPFRFVVPLTFLGLSCFPIQALVFTSLGFSLISLSASESEKETRSRITLFYRHLYNNTITNNLNRLIHCLHLQCLLITFLPLCCQLFPWRFETVRVYRVGKTPTMRLFWMFSSPTHKRSDPSLRGSISCSISFEPCL